MHCMALRQLLLRNGLLTVEQCLISSEQEDDEKIGKIAKHNNYCRFASDTRQSSKSEREQE